MPSLSYTILLFVLIVPHIYAKEPRPIDQRDMTDSASLPTSTQSISASPTATSSVKGEILTEPLDVTINGPIYPPAIVVQGETETPSQGFSIKCNDCSLNGNFSLSAGGSYPFHTFGTPSEVSKDAPSNFSFNDHWAAATVENLNATFEIEVDLVASAGRNEFTIPLSSLTKQLKYDVLTLTATLGTALHGYINSSTDVNFTYGFTFGVPPGSEVIIDLSHINRSTSVGFNESKLIPTTLNATRSDFDIDIELSFRPNLTLEAELDILGVDGSIEVTLGLDVPKLDVEIRQVHNVTSTCDPAPSSLAADQIWPNLTSVVPKIGFDIFEIFSENASFFGLKTGAQQPFSQNSSEILLPTECSFFDQAKDTMGPVPAVKPSKLGKASSAMQVHGPLTALMLVVGIGFSLM